MDLKEYEIVEKDESYLNGMKFNVDIVQMDWYRVCLLHRKDY